MSGFDSVKDFCDEINLSGKAHTSTFRKLSNTVTTAGIPCDLSMFGGHPVTNFYASSPLVAATLLAREGLQHGSNVTPDYKFVREVTITSSTSAPLTLIMLDYLLYYPFIDGDSTDQQDFDNTVTLPRYTDGAGVKAFVVAQGGYTGGAQFFFTYTNQDGVSGRMSKLVTSNTASNTGTLISGGVTAGAYGWSVPLEQGDYGIRSVESFTFLSANGGIFALVLAVDLATIPYLEASIPCQKNIILENALNMPRVYDGAYLNYLAIPNGSLSAIPIFGYQKFCWG